MEFESSPTHACDSLVHSVSNHTRRLADKIDEHIICYDKEYAALGQRLDAYGEDADRLTKAFKKLLKALVCPKPV